MALFDQDLEQMKDRQKTIAVWSFLLFIALFIHMLMDPLLHWD